LSHEFPSGSFADGPQQKVMVDVVKGPLDVRVHYPPLPLVGAGQAVDFCDGIVAAASWSKTIAASLEVCLPLWFKRLLDHSLEGAIEDSRYSQGPLFAVGLGDVHPTDGTGPPGLSGG